MVHSRKILTERDIDIVTKIVYRKNTLLSVGLEYKLTKERIRQINRVALFILYRNRNELLRFPEDVQSAILAELLTSFEHMTRGT